jgi:hypothetical protein
MQTQQRKIPIRGVDGTFKTWKEVLVPFEKELAHFRRKIDSLKHVVTRPAVQSVSLSNAAAQWRGLTYNTYIVDSSSTVFADTSLTIAAVAKELKGLKGLLFSYRQQKAEPVTLTFTSDAPVKILVGFFNSKDPLYLQAPQLETNASANDHGQAETVIANAVVIKGMPPVNIHTYSFGKGTNELKLAKGVCVVLGIVKGDQAIPVYDAGLTEAGIKKEIDWLFE